MLGGLPGFLRFLLAVGTLSLSAIYFNLMVNRHEVLYKNSIPALAVLCLARIGFRGNFTVSPAAPVNPVLLRVLDKTFELHKSERPVRKTLRRRILSGLCGCCIRRSVLLVLLILLGILLLRPFTS